MNVTGFLGIVYFIFLKRKKNTVKISVIRNSKPSFVETRKQTLCVFSITNISTNNYAHWVSVVRLRKTSE